LINHFETIVEQYFDGSLARKLAVSIVNKDQFSVNSVPQGTRFRLFSKNRNGAP